MRDLFWLIVGLFFSEVSEHCPNWAERLIRRSCLRLPEHKRERQRDRWLGELDTLSSGQFGVG